MSYHVDTPAQINNAIRATGSDLSATDAAWLAGLGYSPEVGGGGSLFLSLYYGSAYVWLTCDGGQGMPSTGDYAVGVYRSDWDGGDPEWRACSSDTKALPLHSAVTIATGMAQAFAVAITADPIPASPTPAQAREPKEPVDWNPIRIALPHLQSAVKTMWDAYEDEDRMNEEQPAALTKIMAASLDEWWHDIGAAMDALEAQSIADRYARLIGYGWHLDTRGKDYVEADGAPTFTPEEAQQYDIDMTRLASICEDEYEVAVAAIERIWGPLSAS